MRSFANTYYAKSNFFFFFPRRRSASVCDLCAHREFKVPARARECRDTAESHDFGISNFVYVFYIYLFPPKAWRRTRSILNGANIPCWLVFDEAHVCVIYYSFVFISSVKNTIAFNTVSSTTSMRQASAQRLSCAFEPWNDEYKRIFAFSGIESTQKNAKLNLNQTMDETGRRQANKYICNCIWNNAGYGAPKM